RSPSRRSPVLHRRHRLHVRRLLRRRLGSPGRRGSSLLRRRRRGAFERSTDKGRARSRVASAYAWKVLMLPARFGSDRHGRTRIKAAARGLAGMNPQESTPMDGRPPAEWPARPPPAFREHPVRATLTAVRLSTLVPLAALAGLSLPLAI